MRAFFGFVTIAVLVSACGPEPRQLSWVVVFADESMEARADLFETRITPGRCVDARTATPVYAERFDLGAMAPAPDVLPPGEYAFSVRVRDSMCVFFGQGCISEDLPQPEGHVTFVALLPETDDPECPGACVAGSCQVPDVAVPDATMDADAAPVDTGVPDSVVDSAPDTFDAGPVTHVEIEAEDVETTLSVDGTHAWTMQSVRLGFRGTGYMTPLPDAVRIACLPSEVATCGARMDYSFSVDVSGDYDIAFRHFSPDMDRNTWNWAIDGGTPLGASPTPMASWEEARFSATLAAGPHQLTIFMREPGVDIDRIVISLTSP